MSSTGAGYDYSAGVFSPDGRIFQIEYAAKAVENSGTAIGLKCQDGIVMAVEKVRFHCSWILSFTLDRHWVYLLINSSSYNPIIFLL